jgi:hypothetical protein
MSLSPLVLAEVPGVSNNRQDLLMDDPVTLAFSVGYGRADGLAGAILFPISKLNLRRNSFSDSRSC